LQHKKHQYIDYQHTNIVKLITSVIFNKIRILYFKHTTYLADSKNKTSPLERTGLINVFQVKVFYDPPTGVRGVSFGKLRKYLRRRQRLKLFFQPVIQNLMVEVTMVLILNMMN
jgi:hypothetical protein